MGHDTDVFIVGGGPAGLATAIAARRLGLQVIVADGRKPPIDKTCGEGLLPDAVLALRSLGVVLGTTDGHVLRGIRFEDGGSSVSAEFRGAVGLGVRRAVLHQRMVERAEESGVSFEWNMPVTGLWEGGAVAHGWKIRARWVIGADGVASKVKRWAELESVTLPKSRFACRQHYRARAWSDFVEVHWDQDAQAYVTPVGPEEICVAVISRKPNVRVSGALKRFPKLARKLEGAPPASCDRGATTRMCGLRRVSSRNVALVGDASGSVDAITGEGLALGFRQAAILAGALKAGNLRPYEKEHRRLLRRPRFMADVLLLLGRRSSLRRRTFRALQAAPHIFERMVAYHMGETRPLELVLTGAQFGWQFLNA